MQTHEHDDWMQICQLNPWFNTVLQCDPEFDWAAYARQLPDNIFPKWISKQCLLVGEHSNSIQNTHIPSINIDTLNPKQLRVYNHVKHHFTQLSEHHSPQFCSMHDCIWYSRYWKILFNLFPGIATRVFLHTNSNNRDGQFQHLW